MPSNLELKKSLEQTKKQLVVKDKEIADLNAKLSKFLELEELAKKNDVVNSVKDIVEEIVAVSISTETKIDTDKNPNNTPVQSETKAVDKKKKKRSAWNLYLW